MKRKYDVSDLHNFTDLTSQQIRKALRKAGYSAPYCWGPQTFNKILLKVFNSDLQVPTTPKVPVK